MNYIKNFFTPERILFTLFTIGIISILYSYYLFGHYFINAGAWWIDFYLSIGSGLLGSVLLIYLYDMSIMRKERDSKIRRQKIILKEFKNNYDMYFLFVLCPLKNGVSVNLDIDYNMLEGFFDEKYYEEAKDINLLEPYSPIKSLSWAQELSSNALKIFKEIDHKMALYEPYIDTNLFEKMQLLQKGEFSMLCYLYSKSIEDGLFTKDSRVKVSKEALKDESTTFLDMYRLLEETLQK